MLAAKIMVAYDGSEHSHRALKWALAARPENAPGIDVVTVIPPMAVPASYEIPHMGGMSIQALHESQKRAHRQQLEQLENECSDQGHPIAIHILEGNTAEALLDYADQNGIELIVTGSRGESGFTRLLLGSIAQKLVTYAKVPVVVVK
jgi:Universal stress protein UspA and related nucleotide-binding proteins